ncbi:MAG: aminotransferase class I/II-fold pyridoxal phosphate-dependent enzyme [Alphaproteobacteria bacterium]|nr:aminotransferase class I/II-fold pyridoxal phosphate-dependent enzyme [Alphaproteobacteria bacterium]
MEAKMPAGESLADAEGRTQARLADLRGRNYRIDMTRGKPSREQLDLSNEILTVLSAEDCVNADGDDYRNYGFGTGIPEAKVLLGAYMGVPAKQVIAGGNSSLALMHDTMVGAVLWGVPGGSAPWGKDAKFLCPVPGYDRHFAICERLGIEMINVDMRDDGPDMDTVEALVAGDPAIKGIWCVPKYSNPTGAIYSDAVVERLAAMKTAAADFRIFWDDAYTMHHLTDVRLQVMNILEACTATGHPDRPYMFASTSKIVHPGTGLASLAGSDANIADVAHKMSFQTIGPDKLNQMRHVRFFGDLDGMAVHMEKHATIIAPKFAVVDDALTRNLGGKNMATWNKPLGGYFFNVDLLDGCAAEVVRLAGEAGVTLTPAGATFPYGRDPRDRNLRIAPTLPPIEELERAMEVFCACVDVVSLRKLKAAA